MAGSMPSLWVSTTLLLFLSDGVSESGGRRNSVKAADWLMLLLFCAFVLVFFGFE